ncbi:MAG: NUDIX domain-containing protein [Stellaceae bacterium]
MKDDDVKISARETLHQGFARLDRYRLRHRLYDGGWSKEMEREVFERRHTVGVLLYDPQRDEVVLVEQFRLPAHLAGFPAWELEIVAGITDHDGESAADLARREAREEAGIEIIGDPVPVHHFMPSPGACTERVALLCGRVDAEGAGGIHGLAHEHEDIKVAVLSYRAAMELVRADRIGNGLTILALYWLAANRDRLRQSWR